MWMPPEKVGLAHEHVASPKKLSGADTSNEKLLALQAFRIVQRFPMSMPVARVTAELAYGEGGNMTDAIVSAAEPTETDQQQTRQAAWAERNPLKRWAHIATASAIKRGILVRRPCEVCGDPKTDAHHDDHNRPLEVRWLCRTHHKAEHRRLRQGGAS